MPTIDTSTIEGFETMTADQKVEALLGIDIPAAVDTSGMIQKTQFDKVSSELAEAKKQLKARMTDDEAAKVANDQQIADMQAEIQQLKLEKTESAYKAKYLAMPGFDEKLAEDTAKAMAAGDMDKVFENQAKANAAYEKSLKAELMKSNPRPDGSGAGGEPETQDNVELAKSMGKVRAEAAKASNDILKLYL
jgi:hypothetical protein